MPGSCILVAGIGNLFLGDDGFGCEVAQALMHCPLPDSVHVVDFGIRGLDLAYTLLEEFAAVVLVDAVPRGEPPGTVYVIEPDLSSLQQSTPQQELLDAHTMNPERVLRAAVAMGARLNRVLLVGCEPTPFDSQWDMQMELSEPVRRAVDEAVKVIESSVFEILQEQRCLTTAGAAKESI